MNEIFHRFNAYQDGAIRYFTLRTKRNKGVFAFIFFTFIFSYLLYFPEYDMVFSFETRNGLNQQIKQPFTPNNSLDYSHTAKTEFRLFIPLLGAALGLDGYGLAVVAQILPLLFYFLTYRLFRKMVKDKTSALLLTCSFAFCFYGKSFNFVFFYDAFAFLLLISAALVPATFWQLLLLVCAGFVDERAIVAILIFPLVNLLLKDKQAINQGFGGMFRALIGLNMFIPILAVSSIMGLRHFLAVTFGLDTPVGTDAGVGLGLIRLNFRWIPLALLYCFEGLWLIVILGFAYLKIKKNYFVLLCLSIYFLILTGIAFSVTDITRSLGYLIMLPIFLSGFLSDLDFRNRRRIALYVTVASFLIPSYYIYGGGDDVAFWLSPIIPKVFKLIL